MDRGKWVVVGLLLAGLLGWGYSRLTAQRLAPEGRGEVGRYVVVRHSADLIVIMDTTTGDLYNAVPSDIKPYSARHHGGTPATAPAFPTTKAARFPGTTKAPETKKAPAPPRENIDINKVLR
jgi:hypothetical protein